MLRIYALMYGQLVLYVGRTLQTLQERNRAHTAANNYTHSRYIPEHCRPWEIKLLEDCDDGFAVVREQYYYDTLTPLYN